MSRDGSVRTAGWRSAALLVVVFLAFGEASSDTSKEAADGNRGGWTATAVSGIPAEAELWDVAVKDGVFVATGALPRSGSDDDLLAVWRSTDGVSWTEVHRDRYLQAMDGSAPARVASGPKGFAVVGASCSDPHCQPLALTSADGRRWVPGDVRRQPSLGATRARLLRGTPSVVYEGAAMFDVIDSGGWLAVGWIQTGDYDAEPAAWRTRDAGATWEPIPPEAIPAGGSRADHLERVMAWGDHLIGSGISQQVSGDIIDQLWLSAGDDSWQALPSPTVWRLSGMASLTAGHAFLTGTLSEDTTRGAVWRSEKAGDWQRSDDPGLADLRGDPGMVRLRHDGRRSATAPDRVEDDSTLCHRRRHLSCLGGSL